MNVQKEGRRKGRRKEIALKERKGKGKTKRKERKEGGGERKGEK